MTRGFGTSTGKKKTDEHEIRQWAWAMSLGRDLLSHSGHRQSLMGGPKNSVPVLFWPSQNSLRSKEIEILFFPFGWNKDGKYPGSYVPIVTFSISEEAYENGVEQAFTKWQVHLWESDRNILTTPVWSGDDCYIGGMNLDESVECPANPKFARFNKEFIEGFLIWMADRRVATTAYMHQAG